MKLTGADLPKLQFSLIAALAMIAVGAAGVHISLASIKAAKLERAGAQNESRALDGKLKRVRSEENEIKHKSALFAALQKRGIIGDEKRLEWVELLREIRDKRRLIDLQYEFAPQRPLDATPGNGFAFYSSAMKMQLRLLHEEDLLRLLGDLRRQASALIQIKACNVSRLPHGAGDGGSSAQLNAECEIDWTTLREVPGQPGTNP